MPVVITGGAEVAVPGVWVWTQDHEIRSAHSSRNEEILGIAGLGPRMVDLGMNERRP